MATHTLYIHRASSADAFQFITKTSAALFNCSWQLRAPYDEPQTHNIYCELASSDLDAARAVLAGVADGLDKTTDWELLPNRV